LAVASEETAEHQDGLFRGSAGVAARAAGGSSCNAVYPKLGERPIWSRFRGFQHYDGGSMNSRTTGRVLIRALLLAAIVPAGCVGGGLAPMSKTTQHGYVISQEAIQQVPAGSSQDQVLIALGSPSTTGNYGGEVYYYISQTRKQPVAFMNAKVIDQHVLAVYFDKSKKVVRLADYGKKDGKVFDFISRTTPTGGRDESFIQQILSGVVGVGIPH
jgi:outer membrane protein assembly factor BamE (lipoprotein component of BamABCDE complex)